MKHKLWLKSLFRTNIWLTITLAVLAMMLFLSLPAVTVNNITIPDNVTQRWLPDLLPGKGFTAVKRYSLQPSEDSTISLSQYSKVLQQRLGSTQLSFDSYKVMLGNNEIIVEIPQTLDTQNTNALLTNAGNLNFIISKSKINDIPAEEQLFHFINIGNYDSLNIDRKDIKKIHIRRSSVNTNSQSLEKAPLIFVFSFTKDGEQKIKKLFTTDNFNKLLAIQLDNQVLTSEAISSDTASSFDQISTLNVRYLFGLENTPHIISMIRHDALPTPLKITTTSLVNPLMDFKKSILLGISYISILIFILSFFVWYKKVTLKILLVFIIGIESYTTTIIVLNKLFHLTFGLESFMVLITGITLLSILFISLIYALSLSKKSLQFTMWQHRTRLFSKLVLLTLLFPGIFLLLAPNPFHHLGNLFVLSSLCLLLATGIIKLLFQQLINK